MGAMLLQITTLMSWVGIPLILIAVVDDWFRKPYRQIAAAPQRLPDPPVLAAIYLLLPLFAAAAVVRLLIAEQLDFSAVLVAISLLTGVIWALDTLLLRPRRRAAAAAAGKDLASIPDPGTVDYSRSFFPVALVVLLLRAFIFEPFRIPSDSMMPTLLDGDFIIVNKYAYGLRLPITNRKFLNIGEPQRGDVVVFRYPRNPSVNFIKRLVGLPGDHLEVESDRVIVNGKPVPLTVGPVKYNDGCYVNMDLATEQIGTHLHEALLCPVRLDVSPDPLPGCNRKESRGYLCRSEDAGGLLTATSNSFPKVVTDVPPGMYFMMGDNRDNSDDSRDWRFVPEDNLVGKAARIWFNWDLGRTGGPNWSRIGKAIP